MNVFGAAPQPSSTSSFLLKESLIKAEERKCVPNADLRIYITPGPRHFKNEGGLSYIDGGGTAPN